MYTPSEGNQANRMTKFSDVMTRKMLKSRTVDGVVDPGIQFINLAAQLLRIEIPCFFLTLREKAIERRVEDTDHL